jgi:hypothetical protein
MYAHLPNRAVIRPPSNYQNVCTLTKSCRFGKWHALWLYLDGLITVRFGQCGIHSDYTLVVLSQYDLVSVAYTLIIPWWSYHSTIWSVWECMPHWPNRAVIRPSKYNQSICHLPNHAAIRPPRYNQSVCHTYQIVLDYTRGGSRILS